MLADSSNVATAGVRRDAVVLSGLYVDEAMTIAALAAQFGVAPQTVHNWLVAARVSRRPSPATVRQDISDDEIVGLYVDGGLSAVEIAEQLGCNASSLVYGRLARRGVPRRDRGAAHRSRPGDREIARLYAEGALSLRDLARRYGVSAQAVLADRGWDQRRPPGAPPAAGHEDPVPLYVAGWSAPAIAERLGVRRRPSTGRSTPRVSPAGPSSPVSAGTSSSRCLRLAWRHRRSVKS